MTSLDMGEGAPEGFGSRPASRRPRDEGPGVRPDPQPDRGDPAGAGGWRAQGRAARRACRHSGVVWWTRKKPDPFGSGFCRSTIKDGCGDLKPPRLARSDPVRIRAPAEWFSNKKGGSKACGRWSGGERGAPSIRPASSCCRDHSEANGLLSPRSSDRDSSAGQPRCGRT